MHSPDCENDPIRKLHQLHREGKLPNLQGEFGTMQGFAIVNDPNPPKPRRRRNNGLSRQARMRALKA